MKRMILAAALLASVATPALAQRQGARPQERGQLEAELRRGFARIVKARVGLTDEQMTRLAPITQRHAATRASLQLDERAARIDLQRMLRDSVPPDSARVEALLTRLVDVQKRRVQLLETEQRELATVMSPVQRARFMALQEQLRRQMEDRRRGQGQSGGPPPRRARPPI